MTDFKRALILIVLGLLFAGSLGCLLVSGVLTNLLSR